MASYVKFQLDDGTIVYIESTENPKGASGLIPPGRVAEHAAEQEALSFAKSVQAIRKMTTSLMANLKSGLDEQPEEIGIQFGIKASSELGSLVISRGGLEANYNITLRWQHKAEEAKAEGQPEVKTEEQVKSE